MKKMIKIEGMSCQHCVNHVRVALEDIKGVSNVEVSLINNMAVIDEEGVSNETIIQELEEAGYKVKSIV